LTKHSKRTILLVERKKEGKIMKRTKEEEEQLQKCRDTLIKEGWEYGSYRGSGHYYYKNGFQINFFTSLKEVVVKYNKKEYFWNSIKNQEQFNGIREAVDTIIYLLSWQPEQKLMHENEKYYIDGNGNAWSKDKCLLTDAMVSSRTLDGCEDCIDCSQCEDCMDCVRCANCEHLRDCEDCNLCTDSQDCQKCRECESCNDCHDCNKCKRCEYSDNLKGVMFYFENEKDWNNEEDS